MKILTWNCGGALRKKTNEVDLLGADILVIQECEDPAESTKAYQVWADDYLWVGTSRHKGIGVFAKNGNTIQPLKWQGSYKIEGLQSSSPSLSWSTHDLNLFIPFSINNEITALGVWTKGNDKQIFGYMGQFWKYLQIHRDNLSQGATIVLGDFNSNQKWDMEDRWWSHSGVVHELRDIGLESVYHRLRNEEQGMENTPTFYLYRNEEKPYHIDYVFCSQDILAQADLHVGKPSDWLKFSDHMPLIMNL